MSKYIKFTNKSVMLHICTQVASIIFNQGTLLQKESEYKNMRFFAFTL